MSYDRIYIQKMKSRHSFQPRETTEARMAALAKQHADRTKAFEAEKREFEAYRLQLQKESKISCAIYNQQCAYAEVSKARIKAANIVYQQRLKALKTEFHAHNASIAGLKLQLDMIRAELVSFDMQDAVDMQLEDERRLPAAAATARLERETTRAANEHVIAALSAELDALAAKMASAKTRFELHYKTDCQRVARAALRDLRLLQAKKAFAGHGEEKLAFWKAVRRAVAAAAPSPRDREALEQFQRELERPVVDLGTGELPTLRAMQDYAFSRVREEGGFFRVVDFQY
jgi:hypothetical protein